jgi:hypothetical protein
MEKLENLFVAKFTITDQILAGNLNPEANYVGKLAKKFLNKVNLNANQQPNLLIYGRKSIIYTKATKVKN